MDCSTPDFPVHHQLPDQEYNPRYICGLPAVPAVRLSAVSSCFLVLCAPRCVYGSWELPEGRGQGKIQFLWGPLKKKNKYKISPNGLISLELERSQQCMSCTVVDRGTSPSGEAGKPRSPVLQVLSVLISHSLSTPSPIVMHRSSGKGKDHVFPEQPPLFS